MKQILINMHSKHAENNLVFTKMEAKNVTETHTPKTPNVLREQEESVFLPKPTLFVSTVQPPEH